MPGGQGRRGRERRVPDPEVATVLDTIVSALPRAGVALATALVLYALGRLFGLVVRRRYLARDRPSFANVMSRVVRLVATVLGLLAAATILFPTVKPVDVLGSLGFFSIAIGFAFRDILENLLAGLLLLFRAPFRTGDEVDIEGTRGTVVEINLRETVLRTYDGKQVLLPNATVYKNPIVVQTGYGTVRSEAVVGVAYESDLQQARELALAAVEGIGAVQQQPAPAVLVGELGVSTVDLHVLFWTDPQQAAVRRTRDEVLRAITASFGAHGIEMPADIVVLQGTPSLKAALRGDGGEPTPGGGVAAAAGTGPETGGTAPRGTA